MYHNEELCSVGGFLGLEFHIWKGKETIIVELSALTPIPISEHWLNRFEFKKDDDWKYTTYEKEYIGANSYGLEQTYKLSTNQDGRKVFLNGNWLTTINYVHQLQNLYTALSGDELMLVDYKETFSLPF